ncbi:MAG: heavy metal translocating P-type ATPase [Burkholderiales bacterium]
MAQKSESLFETTFSQMPPAGAARPDCFHCGGPVSAGTHFSAWIGGRRQPVCCPGCEAAATTIVGQGLEDYYRLREHAEAGRAAAVSDEVLALYDDPELQQTFASRTGDGCEAVLLLEGIRCSACAWLNEQTMARLPGVLRAEVNYATHRARVRWDPARIRLSRILGAVGEIGYRARPYDPSRADALRRKEERAALWRLFVAAFGMMQVMMYALPAYIAGAGEMSLDIEQLMRWASLVLTTPVVCYSAAPFFAGAWRDLRLRRLGMDVPVALGIGIAFGASVAATLAGGGDVYFDSVSMFVFLLLVGRYLEMKARRRAVRALQHLQGLVPEFASRLRNFPGSLDSERIGVAKLRPGDLILVKPGEAFPADGVVIQGEGAAGDALLSGESRPVRKRPGSAITGGGVNVSDPLVIRVDRIGTDTVLSSIVRLVERSAAEKPKLVEMAERAASWFVLAVLLLAAMAGIYWAAAGAEHALLVAVSVLVATCPCALSLATPVAHTAAGGEMARRGIVLGKGHVIETLARVTDVVFDKTGTLTRGEMRLLETVLHGTLPGRECGAIAAAIEAASEHPMARAIAASGHADSTQRLEQVHNVAGEGVEAVVSGRRYRIGAPRFAAALAPTATVPDIAGSGLQSIVMLADESGVLASLGIGDELRPEAAAAVAALTGLGLQIHLLSGDNAAVVAEVAGKLGIQTARAAATPDDKRLYVRELQRQGRIVAMVGDGVNDAPVLAQADLSLAMGSGARLAQIQADAVIVSENLADLAGAVSIARKTLRIVRQNIAWAFGYNLVILPLALAGAVTPWAAAIGMSASSLLVVLNALRLVGEQRSNPVAAGAVSAMAAA